MFSLLFGEEDRIGGSTGTEYATSGAGAGRASRKKIGGGGASHLTGGDMADPDDSGVTDVAALACGRGLGMGLGLSKGKKGMSTLKAIEIERQREERRRAKEAKAAVRAEELERKRAAREEEKRQRQEAKEKRLEEKRLEKEAKEEKARLLKVMTGSKIQKKRSRPRKEEVQEDSEPSSADLAVTSPVSSDSNGVAATRKQSETRSSGGSSEDKEDQEEEKDDDPLTHAHSFRVSKRVMLSPSSRSPSSSSTVDESEPTTVEHSGADVDKEEDDIHTKDSFAKTGTGTIRQHHSVKDAIKYAPDGDSILSKKLKSGGASTKRGSETPTSVNGTLSPLPSPSPSPTLSSSILIFSSYAPIYAVLSPEFPLVPQFTDLVRAAGLQDHWLTSPPVFAELSEKSVPLPTPLHLWYGFKCLVLQDREYLVKLATCKTVDTLVEAAHPAAYLTHVKTRQMASLKPQTRLLDLPLSTLFRTLGSSFSTLTSASASSADSSSNSSASSASFSLAKTPSSSTASTTSTSFPSSSSSFSSSSSSPSPSSSSPVASSDTETAKTESEEPSDTTKEDRVVDDEGEGQVKDEEEDEEKKEETKETQETKQTKETKETKEPKKYHARTETRSEPEKKSVRPDQRDRKSRIRVPVGSTLLRPDPAFLSDRQLLENYLSYCSQYWVPQREHLLKLALGLFYETHTDVKRVLCSTHPASLVWAPDGRRVRNKWKQKPDPPMNDDVWLDENMARIVMAVRDSLVLASTFDPASSCSSSFSTSSSSSSTSSTSTTSTTAPSSLGSSSSSSSSSPSSSPESSVSKITYRSRPIPL